ncbi:uncharacterized protein [Epargyreus clarus]|uniref:uncharacterized protein n=1 Tax=Epargyreus clarus TaxID=520877 RepID=UPI003C2C9134
MNSFLPLDEWDDDLLMENNIREYDKTVMPTPDIEFEPYIILNKVRKHYMEYIIKLLSANYERNLRIPSKSLYRLPSAIWRCAKSIEMSAAQTSIVLQLYRRNILTVIQELKKDTIAGKLNKKLYDCLYRPPSNEKRTQTTLSNFNDCNCQCICNQRKKSRKTSESPCIETTKDQNLPRINSTTGLSYSSEQSHIPDQEISQLELDLTGEIPNVPNKADEVSSSQTSDELVRQLEKLFEGDGNDDDIFESVLCDEFQDESTVNCSNGLQEAEKQGPIIEAHSAQIKSLDERLVTLAGLIVNTDKSVPDKVKDKEIETPVQKPKKINTSKWLCEEYFLKMKLHDLLDHIRDTNRNRLRGVKQLFVELFGDDDDEEDLMSPMEETPEFVLSCKERIAPWVVKMLTPYYIKGRIKGKALFKALAKHLIKLIYQCSQYPEQYEVHSFVSDFLKTHKVIRCEADFKEFRIMNI